MRRRDPVRPGPPVYADDIYARDAILDPYPHYSRLRDLGPVVWLRKQKIYALPRHAEVKSVLLDDGTFVSGRGVGLNAVVNRLSRGTILNSDGAEHAARRTLVSHRLTPRALRTMQDDVEARAQEVVAEAVSRRHVDGVADLAQALPLAVVPDLIGWPQEGREHLLRWGAAIFDTLGPLNAQAVRSVPSSIGMARFAQRVIRERAVLPGSMAAEVLEAADRGDIPVSECPALMIDYLAPSLDTTTSAIASALHLFATYPDQWDLLREDRSLLTGAVNEVVRIESPLRAFSRQVARDTEIAGHPLPAGSRVLAMYASANRDEREWESPDRFDIRRDAARQLGFGHGRHGCPGQGLARMQTQAVLAALADRVERIEPTGRPRWAVNNVIRRLERLPLELVPHAGGSSASLPACPARSVSWSGPSPGSGCPDPGRRDR